MHAARLLLVLTLVLVGCSDTAEEAEAQQVASLAGRSAPADATPEATVAPQPAPVSTAMPTVASTAAAKATVEPSVTPAPTSTPTSAATPEPSREPTSTVGARDSSESPAPDLEPTPSVAAGTSDDATPSPDRTVGPSGDGGEVRALRTEQGVMLTVRSAGPPFEVVTPCFKIATVEQGLPIEGPVDVLIDPGHGGEETGAVAPNGLVEADVNLRVAEVLRDLLADRGYRVLLTRYSDHRMAIQARTELANALEPRVFVSIHHNGGFPEAVDGPGTEVFVPRDNAEARRLGGVLFEELRAEFAEDPIEWVGTEALGVSWRVNAGGTDLYGVLRRTPGLVSVLTEAMYMTNDAEADLLANPATIRREAAALARGIERWFDTDDGGTGFIDGLVFRGRLGTGGGTEGCVDLPFD